MQLWIVIVIALGVFGNIAASLVAHCVVRLGGQLVVVRYGTYIHLSEGRLDRVENWFNKRGIGEAVFIGQSLPGVRTFI